MFILNLIKQRAQRKADNHRIDNDARTNKEIEISNQFSGYSLGQITDVIKHTENEIANLPVFVRLFTRKQYQVRIAGLYRAKRRIAARVNLQRNSTIANAPIVVLDKKAA